MSTATMSPADAKTAIYNATVELLLLNQQVGNNPPREIVQCVDGEPRIRSDMVMQGGAVSRRRRRQRQARRKTQNQRHK